MLPPLSDLQQRVRQATQRAAWGYAAEAEGQEHLCLQVKSSLILKSGDLGGALALPLANCVTVGMLFNLSVPEFHPYKGASNSIFVTGLL